MNMMKYETKMWEAAKNKNSKAFLEIVDKDAVMVCGGFRCSGGEYAEIIKEFDVAQYQISNFETVAETVELVQVHYVIETAVSDETNKDLEGTFHITSTWKRMGSAWKLIFNMDSRIYM